ncbi:hypothetical protein [Bacillus sp. RB3]|uniref:hypothetical protein n=1 Tax=Bacillus sp. RB3 TaxID=3050012 RepID=UPI0025409A99|nr:hypothetical protein [Bacillus sp. RB3]MDK3015106.1 hypothetical protein [Bacillus sp. RB3]
MKEKSLVALGLISGVLYVGGTAAFAGLDSLNILNYTYSSGKNVSSPVEGKHKYGTWTVTTNARTVNSALYENCGGTDNIVARMSGDNSNDYYMNGSCTYKVAISSGDGHATVSNYKR